MDKLINNNDEKNKSKENLTIKKSIINNSNSSMIDNSTVSNSKDNNCNITLICNKNKNYDKTSLEKDNLKYNGIIMNGNYEKINGDNSIERYTCSSCVQQTVESKKSINKNSQNKSTKPTSNNNKKNNNNIVICDKCKKYNGSKGGGNEEEKNVINNLIIDSSSQSTKTNKNNISINKQKQKLEQQHKNIKSSNKNIKHNNIQIINKIESNKNEIKDNNINKEENQMSNKIEQINEKNQLINNNKSKNKKSNLNISSNEIIVDEKQIKKDLIETNDTNYQNHNNKKIKINEQEINDINNVDSKFSDLNIITNSIKINNDLNIDRNLDSIQIISDLKHNIIIDNEKISDFKNQINFNNECQQQKINENLNNLKLLSEKLKPSSPLPCSSLSLESANKSNNKKSNKNSNKIKSQIELNSELNFSQDFVENSRIHNENICFDRKDFLDSSISPPRPCSSPSSLPPDCCSPSPSPPPCSSYYEGNHLEEYHMENINSKNKFFYCEDEMIDDIKYVCYKSELQMSDIIKLIQKDLSEPYSIYTYRYFIHNWPRFCFLAMDNNCCVGAIVCKLDIHRKVIRRGYIAMLAVDENYRKRKIGSNLVLKAIRAMVADEADEVVLETEITNKPALKLYENLGFVRDKRLFRYYLNGVDALRLKLWLR